MKKMTLASFDVDSLQPPGLLLSDLPICTPIVCITAVTTIVNVINPTIIWGRGREGEGGGACYLGDGEATKFKSLQGDSGDNSDNRRQTQCLLNCSIRIWHGCCCTRRQLLSMLNDHLQLDGNKAHANWYTDRDSEGTTAWFLYARHLSLSSKSLNGKVCWFASLSGNQLYMTHMTKLLGTSHK